MYDTIDRQTSDVWVTVA